MTEPTKEELLEAAEKIAIEWEQFKSMSIFDRIMDAANERERNAIENLADHGDVENVERYRADIVLARDMLDWYGNMEMLYLQFENEPLQDETYVD